MKPWLVGTVGEILSGTYKGWFVEVEADRSGHGWHIWVMERWPNPGSGTVWDVWADDEDQLREWFTASEEFVTVRWLDPRSDARFANRNADPS